MFNNFDFTSQTLEENVKLLKRLVEIQDQIIIDNFKYGEEVELEKDKKEVEIFISRLKTYIHTQVDDL